MSRTEATSSTDTGESIVNDLGRVDSAATMASNV